MSRRERAPVDIIQQSDLHMVTYITQGAAFFTPISDVSYTNKSANANIALEIKHTSLFQGEMILHQLLSILLKME